MKDFWEKLARGASTTTYSSGMDSHLNNEPATSMQELTDSYRDKNAVQLPIAVGTKVAFMGFLESYMSYDNPPSNGMAGVVVSAKSANGEVTSHEGRVFVKFDDGIARSIFAEHLRLAGCEKLPEGPMRENCEKAKEEGAVSKKKKASKEDLLKKFKEIKPLAEQKPNDKFLLSVLKQLSEGKPLTEKQEKVIEKIKSEVGDMKEMKEDLKEMKKSFVVASLGDLTGYFKVADSTLIHKSTKDLWSFQKDADGNYRVERLYDDNGNPLKI